MRFVLVPVVVAALLVIGVLGVEAQYKAGEYQAPAPGPAWQVQAKTAATHAGFASGGDSVSYVDTHLGHALNCIEGPKGKNFNASWGNVCEGQGNGILVDLRANREGMAWMLVAEAADQLAVAGIKSRDLNQKKNAAKGVAALMRLIAEGK